MRVILDTNVLVSAFISRTGNSARVLDVALTLEDVQLVLSEQIIQEFVRVMSRDELLARFDYTLANVEELARLLRKTSQMIELTLSATEVGGFSSLSRRLRGSHLARVLGAVNRAPVSWASSP